MTLTPLDIHNKEFKRVLRGYAEGEVDEFLDLVVKEYETLIRENGELKDRLDDIEQALVRYRTVEDSLNKTLLLAQQAAEEVREVGQKEANVIRERAAMDAQRLMDEARNRAKQAVADYGELRREAELFRMRMKTMLQAQLEMFAEAAARETEAGVTPFATPPKIGTIASRYRDADGDDASPQETAGLDSRRPDGLAVRPDGGRPNLWGEPATAGRVPPVRDAGVDEEDENW